MTETKTSTSDGTAETTVPENITSDSQLVQILGSPPTLVLLLNGLLAGAGYLYISGYLSELGIQISELEIGLPSLLLHGYIFSIEAIASSGRIRLIIAISAFIWLFTWLFNRTSLSGLFVKDVRFKPLATIFAALLLTASLMLGPALVINYGASKALDNDVSEMSLLNLDAVNKTHIIETAKRTIKGTLIIADQHHTFIRSNEKIYKIANGTQEIIRTIEFSSPPLAVE